MKNGVSYGGGGSGISWRGGGTPYPARQASWGGVSVSMDKEQEVYQKGPSPSTAPDPHFQQYFETWLNHRTSLCQVCRPMHYRRKWPTPENPVATP